jgi:hypothetical protein
VDAVDFLHRKPLEQAVLQHSLGPTALFLRWLENEMHGAIEAGLLDSIFAAPSSIAMCPSWPHACIFPGVWEA